MARDYYDVLGVPRDADTAQLQQAYRKLARQNHPDVNKDPTAEERFKEINEAYHVLADPDTRRRYDRFGENFRQIPEDFDERVAAGAGGFGSGGYGPGGSGRPGGGGGTRARGWRRGPAGGGWASVDDASGGVRFGGAEGIDIEDLLGSLFGAGGAGGAGGVPGADQEAELELSVAEAYRGGRRHLVIGGPDGEREYDVTIPPGVTDGQRIRLRSEGGRGGRGAGTGDLYLVVRVRPDKRFRLRGRDIHVDLPLSPWEAALGARVPVATPAGEAKVTVPAGTSTGRRLRLRGQGMPNPRGTPGDLYAEAKIMVPRRLSARERELFEQLAAASTFEPRTPAMGGDPR